MSCGDGQASGTEPCDWLDLRGEDCVSLGFAGGSLGCFSCMLDTSGCYACGDGALNPGEDCDGEFLGETCESLGFVSGTLACDLDCRYDTSGCVAVDPAALQFDGVDDVVDCGPLGLDLPLSSFTWEAWIKVNAMYSSALTIFYKYSSLDCASLPLPNNRSVLVEYALGLVTMVYELEPGCNIVDSRNVGVFFGSWHHVAFSFASPNLLRTYVDGALVYEAPFSEPPGVEFADSPWPVYIGSDDCPGGVCAAFDGEIDEMRWWNYARSDTEIASSYLMELDGTEPGLVAYWPMDEGAGQTTTEVVTGTPCMLGASSAADARDPVWSTDTPF
jgi:hypothetical protein